MRFIKINIKSFSKYTLTSLFFSIKPICIFCKRDILKIICKNEPYNFKSFKILKDIGTLKNYQRLPFEEINNNYYISFNKK